MDARPTTKLQAVNVLLRAISEIPVSSLSGGGGGDVAVAVQTLDDTTREVLTEGWDFNTEYDFPLTRNTSNEIALPVNALHVDFDARSLAGIDPVIRGQKVYDRENHRYTFDQNLKAKIIFGLAFEDIPEAGRWYITVRAARVFQDTSMGSNAMHQFQIRDEYEARARFIEAHTDDRDLNMLRDTPDFRRVYYNQRRF